ncbi:hypothetical protein BH23BAC1_BH23BAC1_22920 [soil metagenome]
MKFFSKYQSGRKAIILFLMAVFSMVIIFAVYSGFEDKVDFNAEVRPIINTKCISCHGGVKQSGGFSFLFREDALGETESGKPAIVPGHPGRSELMNRLTHHDPEYRMPFEKPSLSEEEIEIFRKWIKQGAEWEDHWAFVKPEPVNPPDVNEQDFIKNDIDKFILQKIQETGLSPSAEASKTTLIRRLSLDLIGLPPSPEEVNDFLADDSPQAYEKVVDRLLTSLHFGEKWAAMWLDLARYSDTKGYEKDQHRNIWRFRDYLIKSFNEDKPYDQFTLEQLAGDLLENPTEDQILATAFHRNTMNNDEGGTDDEEFRVAAVIDRVNTTFDVWQGVSMSCVQCHSHPYDPIRQKEYFNFMAYLNNTVDNDEPKETPLYFSQDDFDIDKADSIIERIKELTGKKDKPVPENIQQKRNQYLRPWIEAEDFDEAKEVKKNEVSIYGIKPGSFVKYNNIDLTNVEKLGVNFRTPNGCNIEMRINSPDGPLVTTFKLKATFGEWFGTNQEIKPVQGVHDVYAVFKKNEEGHCDGAFHAFGFFERSPGNKREEKRLDSLRNELLKAINPAGTPVFRELPPENSRITQVFDRGNWLDKTDTVEARVPEFLHPLPENAPNNRMGMALWLISKNNPLTARVAVNRFWEQIFGFGIVETLEDFGSQGMKPSHPELLDWLALKFQNDYNWSMKKIIKLMVMSATYRQSSDIKPEHLEIDARNKYLARAPRIRLTAEQIRDQALAVGGILSKKMNGPSVMPHQPDNVWQTVYSGMYWKLSEGEDKHRRALYTYMRRTSPYPAMLTFDAPSREFCVVRRIRTNTPLQALVTLNDTVYVEASQGLARRMTTEGASEIQERVKEGFRIALCREPSDSELDKLTDLYYKAFQFYDSHPEKAIHMTGEDMPHRELAALTVVANSIINLDEFLTKE